MQGDCAIRDILRMGEKHILAASSCINCDFSENIQKAFPTPDVAPLIPVPSCSIDWAEPPPSLGYNTCPVWASIKRLTVLDDSFRPGHEFVPEITDNVLNA